MVLPLTDQATGFHTEYPHGQHCPFSVPLSGFVMLQHNVGAFSVCLCVCLSACVSVCVPAPVYVYVYVYVYVSPFFIFFEVGFGCNLGRIVVGVGVLCTCQSVMLQHNG